VRWEIEPVGTSCRLTVTSFGRGFPIFIRCERKCRNLPRRARRLKARRPRMTTPEGLPRAAYAGADGASQALHRRSRGRKPSDS